MRPCTLWRVDKNENELIVLEQIHLFVEVLDRYFGNVCELDIIFNFHKAYYILDELFIGGNIQETSKMKYQNMCIHGRADGREEGGRRRKND